MRDEIAEMYDHRYEAPRDDLPHGPSYLLHVLTELKNQQPDKFRAELRLNPSTFDALVNKIAELLTRRRPVCYRGSIRSICIF